MKIKIGDKVKMVGCMEAEKYPDRIWTVKSGPWDICKSTLVGLEGFRGGFSVECLLVVEAICEHCGEYMSEKDEKIKDLCDKIEELQKKVNELEEELEECGISLGL